VTNLGDYEVAEVRDLPFVEIKRDGYLIRVFNKNVDPMSLRWHWDENDRNVVPINDNDWKFQFDNELPIDFNREVFIPAGMIHRIIKGTTDLVVKIL
jgi:hypothetical protein